jgi:prefoldin subunit 5
MKGVIYMEYETIINQLNYLEGGLELIEKELNELRSKLLKLKLTPNNIKRYFKVKKDYRLVNYNIKFIKEVLNEANL